MTPPARRQRLRLPRVEPTAEAVYFNRRQFLRQLGFAGLGAAALLRGGVGCAALTQPGVSKQAALRPGLERPDVLARFPARRNPAYALGQPLTDELVAATHNNFYEFTTDKQRVWELAQDMIVDPWSIQITGRCRKPVTLDIDDVFRLFGAHMEERTYRFRCVEAWAMDVPWTGFELRRLLEHVEPTGDATFVRFVSAMQPKTMEGIEGQPWYPWPYFEGLRMDEAMNELALLVTGIYGRPLPRQHGAPFRLILPWKYGYKSPKSIVRIELTAEQPPTFWNRLEPREYGFLSNIDPTTPHPRWSQATETVIGTGEKRPTLPFGGYGEHVAHLYA